MTDALPTVLQTVMDCREPRRLADFYRDLFGYEYRAGDETPTDGEDWLVLEPGAGGHGLAFQLNPEYVPPVWTPEPDRPGTPSASSCADEPGSRRSRHGMTGLPEPLACGRGG